MREKLSKAELIQLVEKIISGQGTEQEIYKWLKLVELNVPDQGVSDIIYWPSTRGQPDNLTAEQIVDIALSYKPNVIPLGPKTTNDKPQSNR